LAQVDDSLGERFFSRPQLKKDRDDRLSGAEEKKRRCLTPEDLGGAVAGKKRMLPFLQGRKKSFPVTTLDQTVEGDVRIGGRVLRSGGGFFFAFDRERREEGGFVKGDRRS